MDATSEAGLSIVGVAASAGGLEAMSLLAQNLPRDLNCAYVLAQHMSPSHKSMLVQLLSRETSLKVEEIVSGVRPQPDVIYLPPPGNDVELHEGRLMLREPDATVATPKPSADRLFRSIAREIGDRGVGIVLSGTGSDGSYGVQAIREAGGITIAQEPSTSKYDSMPNSAIRSGCVDLTLSPQRIGQHLAKILARPRDLSGLEAAATPVHTANSDLFHILRAHTLVDFRNYRESTINRRIQRRMIAKGVDTLEQYLEICRRSVDEVEQLYRDLLISVTSFFRDPDHFRTFGEALKKKFAAEGSDPVRIWIPGCATGEEAYSIAILVIEALGGPDKVTSDRLQVFATDIDERALSIGRKGRYPASATQAIPPQYLKAYFELDDEYLTVRQRLKSCVMFTRHNVFQDAPFRSIDVISIRNVLIYFETRLQERVLNRLQYALKPDGLLFLGTSETTGAVETLFTHAYGASKIYRKRDIESMVVPADAAPLLPRRSRNELTVRRAPEPDRWERFDQLARVVVSNGFLTSRDGTILRIYGDLAAFSEVKIPFRGGLTINVLRKPLASEVKSMMLVSLKYRERRSGQWHELSGPDFDMVRMTAFPIEDPADEEESVILIGFATERRSEPVSAPVERTDYVEHLEKELGRARETLQVTIEQLQTSNEELQSLNEEMQSSNEELQSTNEELETSNEELQSTNEELITVNEELMVNTSELERATAELNGLVDEMPTVMMMLDQGLLIRHASRRAMQIFKLPERSNNLGHLSQCSLPKNYPSLLDICSRALVERKAARFEFVHEGLANVVTVTPVGRERDAIIGLVLIVDTVDRSVERALDVALGKLDGIGTWRIDFEARTILLSPRAAEVLGLPGDAGQTGFARIEEIMVGDGGRKLVSQAEAAVDGLRPFRFTHEVRLKDGTRRIEGAGMPIAGERGHPASAVGVIRIAAE